MNGTRLFRPRSVTGDGEGLASRAGLTWLAEAADMTGLSDGLVEAFDAQEWRRYHPGRTTGQVILALADGATCLSDVAVLRNQPALAGPVASQATVWRTFDAVGPAELRGIAAARAAARERAWDAGVGPDGEEPLEDGLADRMLREVVFFLGFDGLEEIDDAIASGTTIDLEPLVADRDRQTVAAIAEKLSTTPEYRQAEGGRGAGVVGIAVQVAEALALYGGAGAALIGTAQSVRWAYRKLSEARGSRVLISLGAAEFLAAADLADRIHSTDIRLFGSGDLRSDSQDRSFSGGDAFFIVLTDNEQLHHYHVSGYGEVFYIGTSPLVHDWVDPKPSKLDPE